MNNHHQDIDGTCHDYLPRYREKEGTATGPMLKAVPSSAMIHLPFFLRHTQHGSHLKHLWPLATIHLFRNPLRSGGAISGDSAVNEDLLSSSGRQTSRSMMVIIVPSRPRSTAKLLSACPVSIISITWAKSNFNRATGVRLALHRQVLKCLLSVKVSIPTNMDLVMRYISPRSSCCDSSK